MEGTGDKEGHEGHGQGWGGDEFIQGLLASGKFSRMPPPPPGSLSLTCSRLVDENNQLKALPEELLRGPNQLLEEIETDESIVASCTQDIGFCQARHSPRPRGQRMARKLRNGIQGVEKVRDCVISRRVIARLGSYRLVTVIFTLHRNSYNYVD